MATNDPGPDTGHFGRGRRYGSFVPLAVGLIAVLCLALLQFQQAHRQHTALIDVLRLQEDKLEIATLVQRQFSTLAAQTRALAATGNRSADRVLRRFPQAGTGVGESSAPAGQPQSAAE
jgi:hypothetical protein